MSPSSGDQRSSIDFPWDVSTGTALLRWFDTHRIEYPWASIDDPWSIWVSEVMLQQTTVGAVEPRYRRWMERFPIPESLAAADEADVLREWEGLGYYSRARNLAAAAREIVHGRDGRIPERALELRKLPGVGPYIASAVASFAFGEPTAALDANGRRIAQRLTAREKWDGTLERAFRDAVEGWMEVEVPGRVNAAVMQLGQQVCTPRSPDCGSCPLADICRARESGKQDIIPLRPSRSIERSTTDLAILLQGGRSYVHRRESGIGRGLWVFPAADAEAIRREGWHTAVKLKPVIHTYTRYRETLVPWVYRRGDGDSAAIVEPPEDFPEGEWADSRDLARRAMPTAYRRIAEQVIDIMGPSKGF